MVRRAIGNATSGIKRNTSYEAESLENKISRMMHNKEKVDIEGGKIIYTERKEGVSAGHNIRTDRFEVAVEAMDAVAKSYKARRDKVGPLKVVKGANDENGQNQDDKGEYGGAKSTQGTE